MGVKAGAKMADKQPPAAAGVIVANKPMADVSAVQRGAVESEVNKKNPAAEAGKTVAPPKKRTLTVAPPRKKKREVKINYHSLASRVQEALTNPKNVHRKVLGLGIMNLLSQWPMSEDVPEPAVAARKRSGHSVGKKLKVKVHEGKATGGRKARQRLVINIPTKVQAPLDPSQGPPKRHIYFSTMVSPEFTAGNAEFVEFAKNKVREDTSNKTWDEIRKYIWTDWYPLSEKKECPLCERVRDEYKESITIDD